MTTLDVDGGLVHIVDPHTGVAADNATTTARADISVFPTFVVELSEDADPYATSPTWADITGHVLEFSTDRGRLDELDSSPPGVATVVVDDPGREFDPDYPSATYGALMVPGRRLRIRSTSPTAAPLFDGFIDSPDSTYGRERELTWHLPAYDLAASVASASVTGIPHGVGEGETTGARIDRVLDAIGIPAGLRDIDTGRTGVAGFIQQDTSALTYISKAAATELGRLYVSRDGMITFRERYDSVPAVGLELHDDGSGDGPPGRLEVANARSRLVNIAEVQWVDQTDQILDTAAVARDGPHRRTFDTLLRTHLEATAYGQQVLVMRSTPARHVRSVTLPALTDPTLITVLLGRELGDRVTIRRTLPVGPALEFDASIERIRWSARGMRLGCELALSPAGYFDQWTAGDPSGSTKKLGY